MHENENIAPKITLETFRSRKNIFIFLQEKFIFMHENKKLQCLKMTFSCMKFLCHDSFIHEIFVRDLSLYCFICDASMQGQFVGANLLNTGTLLKLCFHL